MDVLDYKWNMVNETTPGPALRIDAQFVESHDQSKVIADFTGDNAINYRKGSYIRIPFTVSRKHSDYDTSAAFVSLHLEDLPDEGTLTIEQGGSLGVRKVYYSDAVLLSAKCVKLNGVSSVIAYEWIATDPTETPPVIMDKATLIIWPILGAAGTVELGESSLISVGAAISAIIAVWRLSNMVNGWKNCISSHSKELKAIRALLKSRPCIKDGECIVIESTGNDEEESKQDE